MSIFSKSIDMDAVAKNVAAVKAAMATLKKDYEAARKQVATLSGEIDTLRKASIPASDVVPFLKDYIDAKANEFVGMLNEELANLLYPQRSAGLTLHHQREPISFDELEGMLTRDGEAILGSDYWINAARGGGSTPGYKMLALLSSKNDHGFGRAFCFYFGDQMKAALEANADKIILPDIGLSQAQKLAGERGEASKTTRAQRRTLIANLEAQLATAKGHAKKIQSQMESLGARFDHQGDLVSS